MGFILSNSQLFPKFLMLNIIVIFEDWASFIIIDIYCLSPGSANGMHIGLRIPLWPRVGCPQESQAVWDRRGAVYPSSFFLLHKKCLQISSKLAE